jgi:hypothetical protein
VTSAYLGRTTWKVSPHFARYSADRYEKHFSIALSRHMDQHSTPRISSDFISPHSWSDLLYLKNQVPYRAIAYSISYLMRLRFWRLNNFTNTLRALLDRLARVEIHINRTVQLDRLDRDC